VKNPFISLAFVALAGGLQASTVAYWRFEDGPAGSNVNRNGQPDGTYFPGTADSSGNGYDLSAWSNGGGAGYAYNANTGGPTVSGNPNNLSVKNTGGFPAMWTSSDDAIRTQTFAQFTIEATFKLENGGFRTIVGRDSRGSVTTGNGDLAALYFQAMPNNALAIKFSDTSGYWHEAVSANNAFTSFNFGTDPTGAAAPWYSMAGVSDGNTLSLYLRDLSSSSWTLIAQTDMTLSASGNRTLTAGAGDGGDWDAGNFTVGRGLYAGGHGDRAWGYLDEIRISDTALGTDDFLMVVPEPGSLALAGLGGLLALRRRRRA
jgi:hypothetical protein